MKRANYGAHQRLRAVQMWNSREHNRVNFGSNQPNQTLTAFDEVMCWQAITHCYILTYFDVTGTDEETCRFMVADSQLIPLHREEECGSQWI